MEYDRQSGIRGTSSPIDRASVWAGAKNTLLAGLLGLEAGVLSALVGV